MKINIQIEDATPEEAALVMSGIAVAGAMKRSAEKVVKKFENPPETPETPKTDIAKDGLPVEAAQPPIKNTRRKNALCPEWTDEQRSLITACKTKEEAWEQFEVKYPGLRGKNAVHQRFNKIKHEKKVAAKKAPVEKKPVPVSTPPAKDAKRTGKDLTCPYCQQEVNSHGIYRHVKFKHPEKFAEWQKNPDRFGHGIHNAPAPVEVPAPAMAAPLEVKQSVKAIALSNEVKEPPVAPVVTLIEKLDNWAEASKPATFQPNDRVRQIGGSRRMSGIGVVKRTPQGQPEILVQFENGMEWIPKSQLAAAGAPA